MEKEERSRLEKQLALDEAHHELSPSEFAEWTACKFNFRGKVHRGRTFLVWEVVNGQPIVLDILKASDLTASFKEGFSIQLKSEMNGQVCTITHTPSRVFNYDVFTHVPYLPDVNFIASEGKRRTLRVPLVFKQRQDPHDKIEQADYFTDVQTYTTLFPSEQGKTF
jgi:hypothetical protein